MTLPRLHSPVRILRKEMKNKIAECCMHEEFVSGITTPPGSALAASQEPKIVGPFSGRGALNFFEALVQK